MKITSLFKDKAYAFTSAGNPEDDCDFAKKVINRIKPTFEPKDIRLHTVKDHCDIFSPAKPPQNLYHRVLLKLEMIYNIY